MSQDKPLGPVIHSFFADHLITVKGLRPSSVRSYRDTIRLLLTFAASDKSCKVTRLTLGDLTYDRIVRFLRHLEHDRGNHVRTRNQRLAVLHTFFEYIAVRSPEMLAACQQVTAIPMKRTAPPETRFLERDDVEDLLKHMPRDGRHALRDRALLLFLYNTGASQEAADLRDGNLDLGVQPLTRLHGKGESGGPAALAADRRPSLRPDRPGCRARRRRFRQPRPAADPLRHLQDRQAAHGPV